MARKTVEESLRELPGTAVGIAEVMRVGKIQGVCGDPDRCPMTNWILEQTDTQVSVGSKVISYLNETKDLVEVPLPENVREFIDSFDSGDFKDLEIEPDDDEEDDDEEDDDE
jgi:hypothetical protein